MAQEPSHPATASNTSQPSTQGKIILFVFGATGAGKTTLINKLTGSNLNVGHGLSSCTSEIQGVPRSYKGREIVIYDTPGFDDSRDSEVCTLNKIALFLKASYGTQCANGVIFVHDITNTRVTGASRKNLRMFKSIVGEDNLKNVVFMTNKWSSPPSEEHLRRQSELEKVRDYFGSTESQGARTFRCNQNAQSEEVLPLLDMFFESAPAAFQIQREMANGSEVLGTSAGTILSSELEELRKEKKEDEAEIIKEIEEKMLAEEYTRAAALRTELEETRMAMAQALSSMEQMRTNFEKEREEMINQARHYAQSSGGSSSSSSEGSSSGEKRSKQSRSSDSEDDDSSSGSGFSWELALKAASLGVRALSLIMDDSDDAFLAGMAAGALVDSDSD